MSVSQFKKKQISTEMLFFGKQAFLTCDGDCSHAWGNNWHGEKGSTAPDDPETYEGGDAKPLNKIHNKWCARECERATITADVKE